MAIENYLLKLNPRAIEKYYDLPLTTREDVETRFKYHLYCCFKHEVQVERMWLLEAIESAVKGEGYDRRAGRQIG